MAETASSTAGSSEKGNDWRTTSKDDSLAALDSLWSYDNFENRAAWYASLDEATPVSLDLLVQNIDFTLGEHVQVQPHVGETFGHIAFGKAPLTATVTCVLVDTPVNYSKQHLVDLYKNTLRLTAVALRRTTPVLRGVNTFLQGPCVSMRITETSSQPQDVIAVVFEILVMRVIVVKNGAVVNFDYVHGVESSAKAPDPGTPTTSPDKKKDDAASAPAKDPEVAPSKDPSDFVGPPKPPSAA